MPDTNPRREEGGSRPSDRVIEELIRLNERYQHLIDDVKENRQENQKDFKKISDLLSGGPDTPQNGLIVRVDRIEQHVHENKQRGIATQKLAYGAVGSAIAALIGVIAHWLTRGHG